MVECTEKQKIKNVENVVKFAKENCAAETKFSLLNK